MKKYVIVAYPEDGMPRREKVVSARTKDEAESMGWRLFPEYHEIGVYEI